MTKDAKKEEQPMDSERLETEDIPVWDLDSEEKPLDSGLQEEEEKGEPFREEFEKREQEVKGLKDKILRAHAEVENFKKRAAKDKEEWIKFANEGLLKDLLGVLDNLIRAMDHAETTSQVGSLVEGISLTIKKFEEVLSKAGVTPIRALDVQFDPSFHQAMAQVGSDEEEGMVKVEHQRGYLLHGRVLRPSMVTVSKKKQSEK